MYYVYILTNRKNGTLYIGVTNNLIKRVFEHKNKVFKGFTEKYDINKLIYYECYDNIEYAIQREKRMKKWNRNWKIELIEKNNKEWKDLYLDLFQLKILMTSRDPRFLGDDKVYVWMTKYRLGMTKYRSGMTKYRLGMIKYEISQEVAKIVII